ncbi:hypothetical protein BGY98DRAFT_328265 [Russula aff. rugulosa BPL654]|nr:hypothetical protein BGY98DRAFT_328265 [Russula aff. rugulosa BPL654]
MLIVCEVLYPFLVVGASGRPLVLPVYLSPADTILSYTRFYFLHHVLSSTIPHVNPSAVLSSAKGSLQDMFIEAYRSVRRTTHTAVLRSWNVYQQKYGRSISLFEGCLNYQCRLAAWMTIVPWSAGSVSFSPQLPGS